MYQKMVAEFSFQKDLQSAESSPSKKPGEIGGVSPVKAPPVLDLKCIETLKEAIDFTLYAYDMRLTMGLYMVLGSIYIYIGKPIESIKAFK